MQKYRLASDRIFAVGFSNGANIAASVLLLRPQVLAGAVLFPPMVPLVSERTPNLRARPVLMAAGRRDPMVSPDETERLRRLLSQAGAVVTLHWEEAGHGLTPADIEAARARLEAWATTRGDRAPGQSRKER